MSFDLNFVEPSSNYFCWQIRFPIALSSGMKLAALMLSYRYFTDSMLSKIGYIIRSFLTVTLYLIS